MTKLNAAETFIRGTLLADSAVVAIVADRVYRAKAPTATQYPCIVFSFHQGSDMNMAVGGRLVTACLYLIRTVQQAPEAAADTADGLADLMDAALISAATTTDVLQVQREQPFERSYMFDGIDYEERGGLYRLFLRGG